MIDLLTPLETADGSRARWITGWIAVALSTAVSSFWAFWGANEAFHEGWYYQELWRNLALTAVQYGGWMFIPMGAGLLALRHRTAGAAAHVALAIAALALFGFRGVGWYLVATPLLLLATLYARGRPRPKRTARLALVGIPLLVAVASAAYPGWRVLTRPRFVDTSMVRIQGNGVDLLWAPAGPGWDHDGFSWYEAVRRCEHLSADGLTLASTPQRAWRLPSVDEAVRSMIWRGLNAGGRWDPRSARAAYTALPDKESPLWNPDSKVIYWWTADTTEGERAYRVAFNGHVLAVQKSAARGYLACRCVKRVS